MFESILDFKKFLLSSALRAQGRHRAEPEAGNWTNSTKENTKTSSKIDPQAIKYPTSGAIVEPFGDPSGFFFIYIYIYIDQLFYIEQFLYID
jgi:hypothetical protein